MGPYDGGSKTRKPVVRMLFYLNVNITLRFITDNSVTIVTLVLVYVYILYK